MALTKITEVTQTSDINDEASILITQLEADDTEPDAEDSEETENTSRDAPSITGRNDGDDEESVESLRRATLPALTGKIADMLRLDRMGGGLTNDQRNALLNLFRLVSFFDEDPTDAFAAFEAAFPLDPIEKDGSVLTIIGGVTASQDGTELTLS